MFEGSVDHVKLKFLYKSALLYLKSTSLSTCKIRLYTLYLFKLNKDLIHTEAPVTKKGERRPTIEFLDKFN